MPDRLRPAPEFANRDMRVASPATDEDGGEVPNQIPSTADIFNNL